MYIVALLDLSRGYNLFIVAIYFYIKYAVYPVRGGNSAK